MVKTITLKTKCSTLEEAVKHVDEQLNNCVTDEPVELLIRVDELDNLKKTMEVLFDRVSVQRIKQARLDWSGQSIIS